MLKTYNIIYKTTDGDTHFTDIVGTSLSDAVIHFFETYGHKNIISFQIE